MYWAISIAPPFSRKVVMPVARQLWLQIWVVIPAFFARRCSMSHASGWLSLRSVKVPVFLYAVRKRGVVLSPLMPAASR
jgi:hypothetical protein